MADHTLLTRASATDSFDYYAYHPSLPATITFTALFALTTILHTFQLVRARTWFMLALAIGCLFEACGYGTRIASALESPGPYSLAPYLVQAVLVLIAPTLFAASVYMALGRVVRMVGGEGMLVIGKRGWLTKIFVTGDMFAFGVQSCGASLLSSPTPSTVNVGNTIIIAGLVLQVVSFALFVLVATVFHLRLAKRPTEVSRGKPWRKHMASLYVVSGLIFLRSVVRVVEYVQGKKGYIMTHEIFIYVFDAALMFIAVVTMNAIHPGEVKWHILQMNEGGGDKRAPSSESAHAMMEIA